jgi:hypothetical protein
MNQGSGSVYEGLREDPNAIFEISGKLPSGRVMFATIGPVINGTVAASVKFDDEPGEEDLAFAQVAMYKAMGREPDFLKVVRTPEDQAEAQKGLRRLSGGGQG